MFGVFKSKALAQKEAYVTEVGKMLFEQISTVRDKAQAGRIDNSLLNQRINSMYTAGYLIGFVDEHLSDIFTEDKLKSKYAKRIFEGIFPGSGVIFIQSKLEARRLGETISGESEKFTDAFRKCQEFDNGMRAARYEVSAYLVNNEQIPHKLEQYLSTGRFE